MRTFAEKPKASQQTTSVKSTTPSRANFGQSREVNSILHLQRTIGNQAVQRLIVEAEGNGKGESNDIRSAHFSHDFSHISVLPNAPTSLPSPQRVGPDSIPQQTSYGSSRVHILCRPTVKQPPTPKPERGENPLGTLKDKKTGAEEKIYGSFITRGLWWFNDETPTLRDQYPTTADISVDSLGKGDFTVKVTAGSDKVALDGGGATLSGKDLTKVTVNSRAPSTKHDDVKIELKHRAPGAKTDTLDTVKLEVRAPHHLGLLGTDHLADGSNGFKSLISLRVFDNFATPMPFIDVNEDFSAATLEKGVSSEWKDGFDARTKGKDLSRGNAVFHDQYGVAVSGKPPASMKPQPSNPGSPLGRTKIGSFPHDWYVGSATNGKGVHVSHHVGVFYSDHGEYTKFTSPPAGAKKSHR